MDRFIEKIKHLQRERRLLKKDVAEGVGITTRAYSYYENGQHCPTMDIVIRFARFYNISTDYLLGLSNDPTIHDPVYDEESATLESAI